MRFFLFALALLLPTSAFAQPIELIVRVEDESATNHVAAFEDLDPLAKAVPTRFDGVESVRPVFGGSSDSQSNGIEKSARGRGFRAIVMQVRDSTSLDRIRTAWSRRGDVRYVQENFDFVVEQNGPDQSVDRPTVVPNLLDSLDHLDVIRAREAQEIVSGNASVRIGIIDTGVDLDHPSLNRSYWVNDAEDLNGNGRLDDGDLNGVDDDGNGYVDDVAGYDFVDRPGFAGDGEYFDRDPDARPDPGGPITEHGTLVAGIVNSRVPADRPGVRGVAPGTQYVSIRSFGADGRGQTDDIAAGIVYAADAGLEVINLSFGRDRPAPLIEEAIRYAAERGVTIIASAGNQANDEPHYPSDYPQAISVLWLSEDGTGVPPVSRSQFGIGVDIGAPGSNVYTTRFPKNLEEDEVPQIDDLYGNASGSSFAAPQVAGAAALLLSHNPSLGPEDVRSILTGTAVDLASDGWDHVTAAGRLDVVRALQQAVGARTEITSPGYNAGLDGSKAVAVTGSAIDPAFDAFAVYYATGTQDFDERSRPWVQITDAPVERPVLQDTLATWDVTSLPDGEYTLRLVTTLRDGYVIEDRRRVYVDRTPPSINVRFAEASVIRGRYGVLVDVETDDPTQIDATLTMNGATERAESEYEVRRHGLSLADPSRRGGQAEVQLVATNPAGLSSKETFQVDVPAFDVNPGLFVREETAVPSGRVLPQAADFDDDGLLEVVVNQRFNGGITDTLRSFEWGGSRFVPRDTVLANVIPRDLGDTNGNGLTELLTQIAANTLLLEQPRPGAFATEAALIDTTGRENAENPNALIGTLLTDVDLDGRGEIMGNNQLQWRFLEWNGETYEEAFRLNNPTPFASVDSAALANKFGAAAAVESDFDGDGNVDVLVGDRDGDLIIYENAMPDTMRVAWTFTSDRIDAGDRFGSGDVDGDGVAEFVTFSRNYPLSLDGNEREPDVSIYTFWDSSGDDSYDQRFRLSIAGKSAPDGSIELADFDGDGREEVAISHPPELYVADFDPMGGWSVVYYDDGQSAFGRVQAASMVADDFDGDGTPELLAATTAETLVRYRYRSAVAGLAPPTWVRSVPTGPDGAELRWTAPGADSVTVFAGVPDGELNRVTGTRDSSVVLSGPEERAVALRAWFSGEASPLSQRRTVRPHEPARLTGTESLPSATVRLTFTEPIAPGTQAGQFDLEGTPATGITFGAEGRAVILRFDPRPDPASGRLSWSRVTDASGLAVGDTETSVDLPKEMPSDFIVTDWVIENPRTVRITFSNALNPDHARDAGRYSIRPSPGRIASVSYASDTPNQVVVTVDGILIGATGKNTLLTINDVRDVNGTLLASEGRSLRLSQPASDLSGVYVYPNPYHASRHGADVTVAGLPSETTIRIYSPDGRLVRVLEEKRARDGGRSWDLRDQRGERVPSGMYLIRVEGAGDAVTKRAAVIQ